MRNVIEAQLRLRQLPGDGIVPMEKRFVADLRHDLGLLPDNVGELTFGPTLPNGRTLAILVSNNNFRGSQITQFIALAVDLVELD